MLRLLVCFVVVDVLSHGVIGLGLGGCPFAPGATGNVATEDVIYMLRGMGIDVGPIDLPALIAVGQETCHLLGKNNHSKVAVASQATSRLRKANL